MLDWGGSAEGELFFWELVEFHCCGSSLCRPCLMVDVFAVQGDRGRGMFPGAIDLEAGIDDDRKSTRRGQYVYL